MTHEKIFLIDAFSYLFQAFHAIGPLTAPDGTPTNAVFGFANLIEKLRSSEKPSHLAVAFDTSEPTWRHKAYDQYKANRTAMPEELVPQVDLLKQTIAGYGIPTYFCPGYEADDVIATIVQRLVKLKAPPEICIISSDKDLRQILPLSKHIHFYNTKDGSLQSGAEFREKFGVDPEQVPDYLGLVGDSSDNIPGVKGVGPKTAEKLLHEHKTIEHLYRHLDTVPSEKLRANLAAHKDDALLSKQLATLHYDIPIDFSLEQCKLTPPDAAKLIPLFDRLGFGGRLRAAVNRDSLSPQTAAQEDGKHANPRSGSHAASAELNFSEQLDYHLITDDTTLRDLCKRLAAADWIALDTETTGLDPLRAELVGISLSIKEGEAWYLPLRSPADTIDQDLVAKRLGPILENDTLRKTGQNIKYDMLALRSAGFTVRGVAFDTMVAGYLLEPGTRGYDIDSLALKHLTFKKIPTTDLIGTGKHQTTMDKVDLGMVMRYACEDADIALRLRRKLAHDLTDAKLDQLMRDVEAPLISVLADMEWHGIALDAALLAGMSKDIARELAILETQITKLAGHEFNISSPAQLGKVLFDELKLPALKKTKTGYSTDAEVLEELAPLHELPAKVLEYRALAKLKSTYVDALPQMIHPRTGRVHTSFNQTIAATGRLSSTEPNLQNIPIRTELGRTIRAAFVAEKHNVLLSADYSQIELRVLAHYCGDNALVDAFTHDGDIHTMVAARLFNVDEQRVDPDMRRAAKTVNFGIIYGQTAHGLSRQLGISMGKAAEFIDAYFKEFKSVKTFIDDTIADTEKRQFVTTLLGRRRHFPGIKAPNRVIREESRRQAVNTVIQGSAADLIKVAMLHIHRRQSAQQRDARMLLQIHDELIFEVPEKHAEHEMQDVIRDMTSAMKLRVPLKVDAGYAKNWLECK